MKLIHTLKNLFITAGFLCAIALLLSPSPVHAAQPHGQEQHKQEHKNESIHEGEKEDQGIVKLTAEAIKAQGVIVELLQARRIGEALRASAEIRFNEKKRVVLAARSSGWAKKVAVFANERVKKNQFLASIYSPEFLSAQHEYLLILQRANRSGGDNQALQDDARQRLRILGLTDKEIEKLTQTGQPYPLQHIHSPIRGIVIEHKLNAGDTVEPGEKLYVIANLYTVWAEIALTESQIGKVRASQRVSVSVKAYPKKRFQGKVLSVAANVDEVTRTVKTRALIRNPGYLLKPGMFADAEILLSGDKPVLGVPENATLRSPDGDWVVFVEQEPGHFKAVEIKILRTAGGQAIIEGIKPGARVVTQGAFFIQSELAKSGFDVHNH
jgi:multidrug efflux pump subunit AcrA (membrane-fusion protein)